jgi:hypothetical protein
LLFYKKNSGNPINLDEIETLINIRCYWKSSDIFGLKQDFPRKKKVR